MPNITTQLSGAQTAPNLTWAANCLFSTAYLSDVLLKPLVQKKPSALVICYFKTQTVCISKLHTLQRFTCYVSNRLYSVNRKFYAKLLAYRTRNLMSNTIVMSCQNSFSKTLERYWKNEWQFLICWKTDTQNCSPRINVDDKMHTTL